eukprot:Em0012g583a
MEQVSEYYSELSGEAKARYESKVRNSGITVDPYAIRDDCWVKEMDVANIPEVKWSDMFMYLICTPSPYTREEMKVIPSEVREISFAHHKSTDQNAVSSGHGNTQAPHCVNAPSEADLDTFFKTINGAKHKPGILKVVPPYADQFVPLSFTSLLPPLLTDLYEPEYLQMDYLSLLQKCEDIVKTLKVSNKQIQHLESYTKGQAVNKMWSSLYKFTNAVSKPYKADLLPRSIYVLNTCYKVGM